MEKDESLKGQNKVIHICKNLNATEYYNAVGGQSLYSFEQFERANITLKFLKSKEIKYAQFEQNFVPDLSILDVMMFNSKDVIQGYLEEYTFISQN